MTQETTITRHKSRTIAFKFLYSLIENQISKDKVLSILKFDKKSFSDFCASFSLQNDSFAWDLAEGVGKNLPVIDQTISKQSDNWKIERMSQVDLSILRIAVFELYFLKDIPKNVTIDEAVELAKEYGEKDSSAFINGLLDKLIKAY